ncbi:MAG: hypothetical protein OEL76_03515 [Siculibacillus sp.]|nr:hypothetical protein [Siculibacillus sp.]
MIGSMGARRFASVAAITIGLSVVTVPASAEQRSLGEFGTWRAVEATQSGRRYCFVISAPTSRTPIDLKRDPGSFFVSLRPRSAAGGTEISIEFGYPVASSGNVVSVDEESYALVTRNETAWLAAEADEAKLVTAMRAGVDLRVSARSARGNRTTDVYGLKGFTAALTELQKRCRP